MSIPVETSPRDLKQRLEAGENIVLLDVREPFEHQIASIAGAELIPMREVPPALQRLESLADGAMIAVFCHHGVRSMNVVLWLREQGVENCQSIAGGIDRWSLEVDPAVPRYS